MPKGKTPSLIGSSLGRPTKSVAGKLCPCSRCNADISKGESCYDVPQPSKPFNATRRFCPDCFKKVLEQTTHDLEDIRSL